MNKQIHHIIVVILLQTIVGIASVCAQDSTKIQQDELQDRLIELNEVVVIPKREHYSKHDNPAVDLVRKVIEHKKQNRIENKEKYKVEVYEKLSLSVDSINMFIDMKKYIDIFRINEKPIITLSIRESLSDFYYRKEPASEKMITKAKRHQGLDETFDINGTLSVNIDEILNKVNIFDEDITILLNKFVSPLSSTLATSYYRYYITDTLNVDENKCVGLAFVPSNTQSYGFTGQLYVTLDGHYSVKKVTLNISRNINLNWVDDLRIEQEFSFEDNTWVISRENFYASFYLIRGAQQLYAHRLRNFDHYDFAPSDADSVFQLPGSIYHHPQAEVQSDAFWENSRPLPLREKEKMLSELIVELKKVAFFNVMMKTYEILISDYIPTTANPRKSLFDFGPVLSTYSSNSVEGSRFRIGGITTANLHPRWFAGGYIAYGIDDSRMKYQIKLTHSFIKKKFHENESPANKLSLLHGYDIYTPGEDFLSDKDNLTAINIGTKETKMQYIKRTELQYEKEWINNLTLKFWTRHEKTHSAGTMQYNIYQPNGFFSSVPNFTTSELGLQFRFAPKEKVYNSREGKSSALNLSKDAPIFKLSLQIGVKDLLQSDYSYNHTEASAEKRIWFSSFGHLDASLKAGKVWSRVPFPLLILPTTNQSILIEPEVFLMMRPMEFISDEYISFFMTYYMKGVILNRIPVINQLKLREVASLSGMYGKLSDKNNPWINPIGLFQFPDEVGLFGSKPYMEASIGIENILRIIRIDYYKRLTYLNAPNIQKSGLRIAFRFSF